MRRLAEHRGLVTSQLFDERIFDRAFCRDLARARKTVIIESPYLTEGRAHRFAPIFEKFTKRKVRVRVNTKGPIYHSGEMVARAGAAIEVSRSVGVKVYIYDDLRHRKLAVIDERILWEGSMNTLSHGRSREIMRRLGSRRLCQRMTRFTGLSIVDQRYAGKVLP